MNDILDAMEANESRAQSYELASKGKRFANYLIDLVGYFIFSGIIGVFYGIYLVMADGDSSMLGTEENLSDPLLEFLIGIIVILSYYTLSEYYFKGKTLGKLITKTRAVTEENKRLDFRAAFVRSLCRLIPFEAFSFLGEESVGWHDSIPKTRVIEDKGWRDF